MRGQSIIFYSLSTCVFCTAMKKMLDNLEIDYLCIQAEIRGKPEAGYPYNTKAS